MADFLKANWENIVMANYVVPPEALKAYLPNGCELDFYEGQTYVSLVGFMFKNTRIFKIPIPWLGNFEEINLRFYVTRKEGTQIKRGVVFVNETIPYKAVAWVANQLYKEHYTSIPTKNNITIDTAKKKIEYQWLNAKVWNRIYIESSTEALQMHKGGFEEFIFEHYFGYTKINSSDTEEYRIDHPRWKINPIAHFDIQCDFNKMYGADFGFLNHSQPEAVFLAEGSKVAVKWKRNRIKRVLN